MSRWSKSYFETYINSFLLHFRSPWYHAQFLHYSNRNFVHRSLSIQHKLIFFRDGGNYIFTAYCIFDSCPPSYIYNGNTIKTIKDINSFILHFRSSLFHVIVFNMLYCSPSSLFSANVNIDRLWTYIVLKDI